MTTETALQLLTAEEFYELPDAPHGGKMELICGSTVTHMPVAFEHGDLVILLGAELLSFVRPHKLGSVGTEVGFVLSRKPDTVRAPDVHFVRTSRLPTGPMRKRFFEGAPDLAVEVISPGDTDAEVTEKLTQYQRAGVPRAWVVRPEARSITVHFPDGTARKFEDGDTLTNEDAGFEVEGFALDVTELFGEP